jgi:sulfotransferase
MELKLDKHYHFITGLPRSGSTLISSILLQNPKFHADITDPVATIVKGMLETIGNEPGMRATVPTDRKINMIQGMFDGFYKNINKPVIFNTNRAWTLLTPHIKEIYPKSKLIVCVRDINRILDSFEVAHRKNPLSFNTVGGGPGRSVYDRVEDLMDAKGIVGFPYIGIKQAITSNEKDKLLLIEYDKLCKNPKSIMQAVYAFLQEPYYDHDFDNVEASWDDYDAEIGIKLHQVRKKVEFVQRQFILPPDILQKYANMEVWRL